MTGIRRSGLDALCACCGAYDTASDYWEEEFPLCRACHHSFALLDQARSNLAACQDLVAEVVAFAEVEKQRDEAWEWVARTHAERSAGHE